MEETGVISTKKTPLSMMVNGGTIVPHAPGQSHIIADHMDNQSHPPDIQNGEIITIRHQRYRVAAVGRRHLKLRLLGPK